MKIAAGVWFALVLAIGIGYVMNIVALCHSGAAITTEFVLRVVGLFVPPLGAILGYFL